MLMTKESLIAAIYRWCEGKKDEGIVGVQKMNHEAANLLIGSRVEPRINRPCIRYCCV